MNILALDPGSTTGYAVVSIVNDSATVISYGSVHFEHLEYFGDTMINVMNWLDKFIKDNDIQDVGIENYFASSRFANGTDINYYIRAAIQIKCRQLNLPYTMLNISEWKMFIADRSTPSKEDKKKYGKDAAKKIFIQAALWKKWKIRFPNHSLSDKTNKPIVFKMDPVDAVGQAIFFVNKKYNIEEFSSSVIVPKDEIIKSKKKIFVYP